MVEDVVGLGNASRMAATIVGISSLVNVSVRRRFVEAEEVFSTEVFFLMPCSLETLQTLVDVLLLDYPGTLRLLIIDSFTTKISVTKLACYEGPVVTCVQYYTVIMTLDHTMSHNRCVE